jgi:hypothetical protein
MKWTMAGCARGWPWARIRRIRERERLLGAQPDAGDEAQRMRSGTLARAPRIVKVPNSSRLNW